MCFMIHLNIMSSSDIFRFAKLYKSFKTESASAPNAGIAFNARGPRPPG